MYSPLHAPAGLLIAASIPNPAIGLPLAILSHYVLDSIPHGDLNKPPLMLAWTEGKRLAITELIDLPLAALVVWRLAPMFPATPPAYLIAAAIAGIVPDLLWGGKFLLERIGWNIPGLSPLLALHHRWHEWIHIKEAEDIPFLAGIAYHLAIVGGLLLL